MSKQTTNRPRGWTDEEYGIVADSDRPIAELAEILGRSHVAVAKVRNKIRKGWTPAYQSMPSWTEEEDAFLVSHPKMTYKEVAVELGRTPSAVQNRRRILGERGLDVTFGGNWSPFMPGPRTLLSKTCPECGLLLPAKWFQYFRNGANLKTCKRCHVASKPKPKREPRDTKRYNARWFAKVQAITAPNATNSRNPWTEADEKVAADPSLTNLEKALKLKRTYASVQQRVHSSGYTSRNVWALGDPLHEQWIIDNPNLAHLDVITASLRADVEAQGIEWQWDWDDDDLEPVKKAA